VGKKQKVEQRSFWTANDFHVWRTTNPEAAQSGWIIKAYKGLGTSVDEEAHEYFRNLKRHLVPLKSIDADMEHTDLEMIFGPKTAARKIWLSNPRPVVLNLDPTCILVREMLHGRVYDYSNVNNVRHIPDLLDGLTPSARQCLYTAFLKAPASKQEGVKLNLLTGAVLEHTNYEHADTSLGGTLTKMAQGFVGALNLPLLVPIGQFGTRAEGGQDAADARYIFTRVQPYTEYIFPDVDRPLLPVPQDDENHYEVGKCEPAVYSPIVPMILINGARGTGTSFATRVTKCRPSDIVARIRALLDMDIANLPATDIIPDPNAKTVTKQDLEEMGPIPERLKVIDEIANGPPLQSPGHRIPGFAPLHPWARNFRGTIMLDTPITSSNVVAVVKEEEEEQKEEEKVKEIQNSKVEDVIIEMSSSSSSIITEEKVQFKSKTLTERKENKEEKATKKRGRPKTTKPKIKTKSKNSSTYNNNYVVTGLWNINEAEKSAHVTELPLSVWTSKWKEHLDDLSDKNVLKPDVVIDNKLQPNAIGHTVYFQVGYWTENLQDLTAEVRHDAVGQLLRLHKPLDNSNMTLWTADGKLRRFDSFEQILLAYLPIRLKYYERRKTLLEKILMRDCRWLEAQLKFVQAVAVHHTIDARNKKTKLARQQIYKVLKTAGSDLALIESAEDQSMFGSKDNEKKNKTDSDEEDDDMDEEEKDISENEKEEIIPVSAKTWIKKLLAMRYQSVTIEKIQKLQDQLRYKQADLAGCRITTAKELWLRDLNELENILPSEDVESRLLEEPKRKKSVTFAAGTKSPRPSLTSKTVKNRVGKPILIKDKKKKKKSQTEKSSSRVKSTKKVVKQSVA